MLNHYFIWNGRSSEEFGIRIEKFRDVNRPAKKYIASNIYGRNGNNYSITDSFEEVTISYEIFANIVEQNVNDTFADIMEWLSGPSGYARLEDSYDVGHYRDAVFVGPLDVENTWNKYGRAVISFRCRPERFIALPEQSITLDDDEGTIVNPTKHIAKPVITLTGSGMPSLLRYRNRTEFKPATVKSLNPLPIYNDEPYDNLAYFGIYPGVDTFEASFITASTFASQTITLKGTSVGAGVGFPVRIFPNTTYSIRFTYSTLSVMDSLDVYLYDASGWYIEKSTATAYGDDTGNYCDLTFRTTSTAAWAMVIFRVTTANANCYAQKIMLTATDTPQTYSVYNATASQLIINDKWQLDFDLAYGTLTIDCDKEQIYADGQPFNLHTVITPLFGAEKDSFPYLNPGTNTFHAESPITAITVDPRFWEV